jgi:hypothetical protein
MDCRRASMPRIGGSGTGLPNAPACRYPQRPGRGIQSKGASGLSGSGQIDDRGCTAVGIGGSGCTGSAAEAAVGSVPVLPSVITKSA